MHPMTHTMNQMILRKTQRADFCPASVDEMNMDQYLKETPMLDFSDGSIRRLIENRKWCDFDEFERVRSIYNFVRDEILFGYNTDDSIPASKVLHDGYGQCNTKGTLFMALLRACGIPCRIHGFTIDKKLQKGAMTGLVYKTAPQNIFHSWVEVYFENTWYELEAFILDRDYLEKLQSRNGDCDGPFCGCGSGALTIACAKRNPQGRMVGLDRWGKEYASFSLPLCQNNAKAENVSNTEFRRGNATKLDFPDESFDAVTSNYVYHNITGADKQQLLLEKLRVLKKGGAFAIHDLTSQRRYGDMQSFVKKLRDMGYERVELIDLFWWRNTKRIRFSFLPEKEIYQNPAKHIGSFVRGIPLFAVIAALSALVVSLF